MNTTTIRAGLVAWVFLCFTLHLTAQSTVTEDLTRADKQFDLYAYNLALRTYDQALQKEPKNAHALARMADCHFQLNRPQEALPFYDKALQLNNGDANIKFRYGIALMHTGDYIGAKKWFKEYAASNAITGQRYVEMCDYALANAGKDGNYVAKNEPLNTESSDYAPAFFQSRVVYNSTRTDIKRSVSAKSSSDWSGSAYNQLFVTQKNPESSLLQKPVFLRSDLQNAYNEGPVSFSADGKRVAFCRNNFIDGTRQIAEKGLTLSLYTADVSENGNWTNIKPFPYNGSDYATGFPCLSPDGNTLLFAANQPSGYGGWDIFVSNYTKGEWTTPRNLGAPLNTPGNEITPFYDGKNFFFSSDWHNGFGGLDVFRADLGQQEVTNIYHLGPGINTARDDYGFIFNADQNIGYLTSNRAGGRGQEDIWQITKKWNDTAAKPISTSAWTEKPVEKGVTPTTYSTTTPTAPTDGYQHLLVTDEASNPLNNVEVDFLDCGCGTGRTDASGKYYFEILNRPIDCNVSVRRDGYLESTVQLYNFGRQNVLLAMSKDKKQAYNGFVMDLRTHDPIFSAVVLYQIPGTDRIIQTSTDSDGRYSVSLDAGVSYDITYSKEGYKETTLRTKATPNSNRLSDVLLEKPTDGYYVATPVTHNTESPQTSKSPNNNTVVIKPVETPNTSNQTPLPFSGYAIQVAASPDPLTKGELQLYESLSKYGNIYVKTEGPITRVRLGVYPGKEEAQKNLRDINAVPAFKNAFLIEEYGADPGLILGPPVAIKEAPVRPTEYNTPVSTKGLMVPAILYAVQIGSFAADRPINLNDFTKAASLGNVYTKQENGLTKVRLGVWVDHPEAEKAQNALVARGYQDAIVVTEKGTDPSVQGFIIAQPAAPLAPAQYSTNTAPVAPAPVVPVPAAKPLKPMPYLIQVAALANPDKFEAGSLEDLGIYIEKRKQVNGMTLILLNGFQDLDSAKNTLKNVKDLGYDASFVLKDNKGKLVRVQ